MISSELQKIEYWQSLNPDMNVTGQPYLLPASKSMVSASDAARCRAQMIADGYYVQPGVLSENDVGRMARTILNLAEHGLPPVFGFIYDEFWRAFRDAGSIVESILGPNYQMVTNFWAWNVLANDDDAGFPPHRDIHAPNDRVLGLDGLPRMSTVWIPLSDVTPAHSCMHILPTSKDPNLPISELCKDHDKIAHEQIMDIRALPATAGSVISWNMEALHWGSNSSKWANGPRISIAAYLKRADMREHKSFAVTSQQPLTLDCRIGLIGIVLEHYDKIAADRHHYPPDLIKFCAEYRDCQPVETRFP